MQWITPSGQAPLLCMDALKQPHILIAGATGSGKSVFLNSLICTALFNAPPEVGLILIDPKRVDLIDYAAAPHVMGYASEPDDIASLLYDAVYLMEQRYIDMQRQRQKVTTKRDLYIVIDEFADLMTTQKRETLPALLRIAQLGRAAKIHLILATQRPTRDIINGQIKVNLDARLALRCPTAQDSRNVLDRKGAENLPRYGYGYYLTPETITPELVEIPLTPPEVIAERVRWWCDQVPPMPAKKKKRRR